MGSAAVCTSSRRTCNILTLAPPFNTWKSAQVSNELNSSSSHRVVSLVTKSPFRNSLIEWRALQLWHCAWHLPTTFRQKTKAKGGNLRSAVHFLSSLSFHLCTGSSIYPWMMTRRRTRFVIELSHIIISRKLNSTQVSCGPIAEKKKGSTCHCLAALSETRPCKMPSSWSASSSSSSFFFLRSSCSFFSSKKKPSGCCFFYLGASGDDGHHSRSRSCRCFSLERYLYYNGRCYFSCVVSRVVLGRSSARQRLYPTLLPSTSPAAVTRFCCCLMSNAQIFLRLSSSKWAVRACLMWGDKWRRREIFSCTRRWLAARRCRRCIFK